MNHFEEANKRSFADGRGDRASQIALAYSIIDPAAVGQLIEALAIGNDEPEASFGDAEHDRGELITTLEMGMTGLESAVFMLPGGTDPADRTTVSMLASVLENPRIDQLGAIAAALNRSVAALTTARVRHDQPMHPRRALLIAKLGTAGQFWIEQKDAAPDGGFVETEGGLVPEPGTAVAMFVDCLDEAGCDYGNAEIRGALGAMMASLELPDIEAEGEPIEA